MIAIISILLIKNLIDQQHKILNKTKQANLVPKADIDNFVKRADFDDKLKNLNKKVTSNEKKLC